MPPVFHAKVGSKLLKCSGPLVACGFTIPNAPTQAPPTACAVLTNPAHIPEHLSAMQVSEINKEHDSSDDIGPLGMAKDLAIQVRSDSIFGSCLIQIIGSERSKTGCKGAVLGGVMSVMSSVSIMRNRKCVVTMVIVNANAAARSVRSSNTGKRSPGRCWTESTCTSKCQPWISGSSHRQRQESHR